MKVVILSKNGKAAYRSVKEPPLGPKLVKVRVMAAGLCGSDIQKMNTNSLTANYGSKSILGHEVSGTVVGLGKGVKKIKIGDRTAINPLISCGKCEFCKMGKTELCTNLKSIGRELPGGFAEFVFLPEQNVKTIGNKLKFETAALADVVACALHCYHIAKSPRNKDVLVIGDGPIALICGKIFSLNSNRITIIGKHQKALSFASKNWKYNTTKTSKTKEMRSDMYDYVIEAVGGTQEDTIKSSVNLVKKGGTIIVMGVFENDYHGKINYRKLFYKEGEMIGSNSYTVNEFAAAVNILKKHRAGISKIITHKIPINRFRNWRALINNRNSSGAIKIMFVPK